ncbi:cupredoxin domain-containing protein [Amycolatopsis dendrobii]|uniref:Cupredoxin domain-containing protein n=1 Tax=Amycolatopsis dendrobii TaxID=2760662 RepID=A0A7W3ZDW5_9PSEU|nr:cupredoxin domain-containing protein [Amycolatopsis dendrobii]MBB1157437.1 cupredoxin domain-containing protein [Amycolatopsis dendrobii]
MKHFLLIIAAALALPACAASPPAAPPPAATPMASMPGMTPPPSSSAATASSTANAVAIKDFAFAPAATTVKKGTTVTWTNQDQDAHTVTSTGSGGPLRSPTLQTGQSYQYTFGAPGTFEYLCTIHPFMTATVTVTP